MRWCLLVIFAAVINGVFNDSLPDISQLQHEIDPEKLDEIAEKGKKVLRDKCLKVSGSEDAYNELEEARGTIEECFSNLVDINALQAEINETKQRGAMEEVFGKYCKKRPEALACVDSFKTTLEKCLYDSERDTVAIVRNLTESLLDFVCHKDGDRIAMFIAEGGVECIQEKEEEIKQCANETLNEAIPKDLNVEMLGLMVIDEEKCDKFTLLQKCVTKKLETCKNQTPANVVESLFKYIKKSLPCDKASSSVTADGPRLRNYNRLKRQTDTKWSVNFREKCSRNSQNRDSYDNLNMTFTNLYHCARQNILSGDPDQCTMIQKNVKNCVDIFIPELRSCLLSPQEDFLPELIRNSMNSALNYICKDNAKALKDFRADQGLKCLDERSSKNHFSNCLQPKFNHKVQNGQIVIEEKSFCEDLSNVKKCAKLHMEGTDCVNHKRTIEIIDDFIGAFYAPCSACVNLINTGLLAAVILFYVKRYLI